MYPGSGDSGDHHNSELQCVPAAAIDGPFIRPRTNLELGLGPTKGFDQGTHQHLLIQHNQPSWGQIERNEGKKKKQVVRR